MTSLTCVFQNNDEAFANWSYFDLSSSLVTYAAGNVSYFLPFPSYLALNVNVQSHGFADSEKAIIAS